MRIINPTPTNNRDLAPMTSTGAPDRIGPNSTTSTGGGSSLNAGDQATLGSSTVSLTASALGQPEVRTDLVNQFRAQLNAGSYTVNSDAVAGAMLSDPQTGLGKLQRG
ncbi:MAG: flagellar biosynthesis anti-sigma factor FlgM [Terriglobales bacterium]